MKAKIEYQVDCSHEAFMKAMEHHMPGAKYHEIVWRDTASWGDDEDTFSSFEWPNKRHPELTKQLFFKMAFTALHNDRQGRFHIIASICGDDGVEMAHILHTIDMSKKDDGCANLAINREAFNADLADRLARIKDIASEGEDEVR